MSKITKYAAPVIILITSAICLQAEEWVRGAAALVYVEGQVNLSEMGEDVFGVGQEMLPLETSGLFRSELPQGSTALFRTSNRMRLQLIGSGRFSVERFDQWMPSAEAWAESSEEIGRSRTIINFRAGSLTLDSRALGNFSQCLVETPLGRVSAKQALWHMKIEFDPRSRIFDFLIECGEGNLRFTDKNGLTYRLRAGQRLAGVGDSSTPSIEVAEATTQTKEHFERFEASLAIHSEEVYPLERFQAHFDVLDQEGTSSESVAARSGSESGKRPVVIEYAPVPKPVTPFRGALKPPSAYQADIF